MKKSVLILIAIIIGLLALNAKPKPLKQAEKLIGNFAEREQARKYAGQALADSVTALSPEAHYVAGRIEKEIYRHYYKLLSINKNDPNVDHVAMADALMSAYHQFVTTLSLDTILDKKGKQKITYSPQISEWISSIAPAIYNAGIAYMNKQSYYPGAYTAFMTYASLPDKSFYRPPTPHITDSLRANAYFYGGVMAYNAKKYNEAADAFEQARNAGYPKKEAWLNQMSCLANIAKTDTTALDSISRAVTRIAADGFHRFGITQPLFIQKFIAGLMLENECDSALHVLSRAIEMPDAPLSQLYTLQGAVLALSGDATGAADAYKQACSYPDASFSTLQKGSQHIAMVGLTLIDTLTGTKKEQTRRKKQIRADYLQPALTFARRATEIDPTDPTVLNTIETITYYLH